MSYHQLAAVYDQFMRDAPYDEWVNFTTQLIGKSSKKILDLGAGTGSITRKLHQLGHEVTGVDLSEDMLTEALQKAQSEGLSITWIRQDITKLEGFTNFDVVVSYCDVINYVTDEQDVLSVFKHAFDALNEGGTFIFDVHSINHVRKMIDEVYSVVEDDMSYIWFCEAGEYDGDMHHDLTFFIREGDKYERFDENHHQRTYAVDQYKKWLQAAGFNAITIYGDFSPAIKTKAELDQSERLFFVAVK